jgi:tryptophan synthase alpha chain
MKRIEDILKGKNLTALVAYITVGYPSIEATLEVVPLLADCGCDIIELGIPFSDPLADGATIQKASFRALKNGVTPETCLEIAKKLSKQVDAPLVFMTYYNPIYNYGLNEFSDACARAGVSGLIVPDLPLEESSALQEATGKNSLDLVYLLAPTSTDERIKEVAEKASGFIYLVSLTGVTGARNQLPVELEGFVKRVRSVANQPLCVGFGISTAEQAIRVARVGDGVIIGSRIVKLMEEDPSLKSVADFIKEVRLALDRINSD